MSREYRRYMEVRVWMVIFFRLSTSASKSYTKKWEHWKLMAFSLVNFFTASLTSSTVAPTTTRSPTTKESPTTTETPSTTKAPSTTEAPTTTEQPTTTEAPTTTEKPTTTESPTTSVQPTTTNPGDHPSCSPGTRYDAVFVDANDLTYFFKGDQFWTVNSVLEKSEPKQVRDSWPDVITPVDAAYRNSRGSIVFFKGKT